MKLAEQLLNEIRSIKINEFKMEDSSTVSSLIKSKYYNGEPLEKGGTALSEGTTEEIRNLATNTFEKGSKILLYGAGKGRNARFLRSKGFKVYAYDPFNGADGADGFKGVSKSKPSSGGFDYAISVFVLNVVPKKVQDIIINDVASYAKKQIHITRNMDIPKSVSGALSSKSNPVWKFFVETFLKAQGISEEKAKSVGVSKFLSPLMEFGVETSRGFQRIPFLEDQGFTLNKETESYKSFTKNINKEK